MSSQQQLGLVAPPLGLGEVDHVRSLSDNLNTLLLSDNYQDITLIVENQRIPAHKIILASRSEYFRALLFGGLLESQKSEIELKGISAAAFHVLLKYVYTGYVSLSNMKEELVKDLLGLAHQYAFPELEQSVSDYLKSILSQTNMCLVYDVANLYQLRALMEACRQYADKHATDILQSEAFLQLSPGTLCDLLQRDSFCVAEIEIFRAVLRWWHHNSYDDCIVKEDTSNELNSVLKSVRLPLITLSELLNEVRPSHLVSSDVILDALKFRTESRDSDLPYRGQLMPEVNVAHSRLGAQVLQGEMRTALLDGETTNYDMERGFTRHPIEDGNAGIVVRLGQPSIINHIKVLLWDRDMRSYSYFIEVSMDQRDWVRVVDYSNYHCRSWQRVYFPQRVVRFIRIVGTHNTVNKVFHVVSLEAYYSPVVVRLEKELIVPKHNVATIQLSACVVEGVSRSRNALLNGDTKNYDWDSGYTCHQLGSGAIVVQLAQPYIVSSMRLLLWDCDDRRYSFYVEVSTNNRDWITVCDRSRQPCQSWQSISFVPQPVVYVRIVGTQNTANDVFHCVHFECPAQEDGNGFEEVVASTPQVPVDAPLSNPSPLVAADAAIPPAPPPLPDHFSNFNPRPLDRERRNLDEEEEIHLPIRFTGGSLTSQRSPRQ
ncbi:BTB/POZ domain-containing protein 9-like [Daphnia carinata]|uniref:BTB/POZ domain-containing protein 9-like n=1 Tax=Daphnia carinata TaxID=120202 RepID=UPI00257B1D58|nr:BTB/POZ domain-containing protein 9-like [Daphnia carinata]